MSANPTKEIHALVSIFTHFAGADNKISDEEILFIFATMLKYYSHLDKIDLTRLISELMDEPLSLKESIDMIKKNPQISLHIMLQSTMLVSLDRNIDFFEETVLRVVSKELFNIEANDPIEELITQLKGSFEEKVQSQKDSDDDLDWL